MHRITLGLCLVTLYAFVWISAAHALPSLTKPQVKPPDEQQKRLDEVLDKWDKKMQSTTALHVELERVERDKTFKKEEKFTGLLDTLRIENKATVEHLWRIEMNKAGTTELHEKLIRNGEMIFQFAPFDQKIYATAIPKAKPADVKPKAKPADVKKEKSLFDFLAFDFTLIFRENLCSLVLFAKTAELRKRYDLKFSDDKQHPNGEDMHYIYVKIEPRGASDRADFEDAEVVLSKESFLPCRLWFKAPNKSEIMWNVIRLDDKAKLAPEDFAEPCVPPGWKLVPVDTSK